MSSSDLGDWFRSVPLVTRYWLALSAAIPLLGRFGLISAQFCYLAWEPLFYKFNFWRPVTALIFYPVTPQTGFHWLLMLYFLYNYSKNLESGVFDGRPADYFFMLSINWLVCTGLCLATEVPFMLEPMVLSVLYVWCNLNRETVVSFWFGTRFKAVYLPWVLAGFNMVLRGGGLSELLGIIVGHIYYFVAFKYPNDHGGATLLKTPQFLYSFLPNEVGGVHGFGGNSAPTQPANRGPAVFGGRGQQLGD